MFVFYKKIISSFLFLKNIENPSDFAQSNLKWMERISQIRSDRILDSKEAWWLAGDFERLTNGVKLEVSKLFREVVQGWFSLWPDSLDTYDSYQKLSEKIWLYMLPSLVDIEAIVWKHLIWNTRFHWISLSQWWDKLAVRFDNFWFRDTLVFDLTREPYSKWYYSWVYETGDTSNFVYDLPLLEELPEYKLSLSNARNNLATLRNLLQNPEIQDRDLFPLYRELASFLSNLKDPDIQEPPSSDKLADLDWLNEKVYSILEAHRNFLEPYDNLIASSD